MGSRRLAANVLLRDPATGTLRTFAAGDTVPDWAAEMITNNAVYEPGSAHDTGLADGTDYSVGAGSISVGSIEVEVDAEWAAAVEVLKDGGYTPESVLAIVQDADNDGSDGGASGDSDETPVVPPKGGPGSGRDAWAEYASAHGVTVAEADGRDEIIAALDAAGKPTE